jgi:hypothetical protein
MDAFILETKLRGVMKSVLFQGDGRVIAKKGWRPASPIALPHSGPCQWQDLEGSL